ncbi:MAG: hypothetical protein ACH0QD_13270 [Tepidibacillus sp.]
MPTISHCHSCGITPTPEHPIPLFQLNNVILCTRCIHLEKIGILPTIDILGNPPDRIVKTVFYETLFIVPPHSISTFQSFYETAKKGLLLKVKEEMINQKANVLLGVDLGLHRIETSHYFITLKGLMAWSNFWNNLPKTEAIPLPVTFSKPKEEDQEEEKEETEEKSSIVGKYPDVGGGAQMNRFRKLTQDKRI